MFKAEFIDEPDLVFGNSNEEKDPRIGIMYLGPYYYSSQDGPEPMRVKVGIVGDIQTIEKTKELLNLMHNELQSSDPNKWLHPDFPGYNKETKISSEFILADAWNSKLVSSEVNRITTIADVNERITSAVNLFKNGVSAIASEDDTPDVIICALPQQIEEFCGISINTRGAKRPKFTNAEKEKEKMRSEGQRFLDTFNEEELPIEEPYDKDYDFRNALKGKIMEYGIPIQLLKWSTLTGILEYDSFSNKATQDPAGFAWNFTMGLYYKARGKPWRLAKLRQDTCYIGVSFYKNKLTPKENIETSMAQVFTHNGEGIVLRGTEVERDEFSFETHMTDSQAEKLIGDSIKRYTEKANRLPSRVVIHKTSQYSEGEINGIKKVVGNAYLDLVAIKRNHNYRFMRTGDYPILRGTMISLSDTSFLLFTNGYVPRIRTYEGHRIPVPLFIQHNGDSSQSELSKEILGLTKLNWNTTKFATQMPITLEFADKVGDILSELPEESVIKDHYRFYM